MADRVQLIAELATGHGGDLDLAEDLIMAAAEAGADYAKTQAYSLAALNPRDPQAEWLRQSYLDPRAHVRLMEKCQRVGIKYLSTPFDADSLRMLRDLGLNAFKIASSESSNPWWQPQEHERWFVSWPWGDRPFAPRESCIGPLVTHMTAIPLYPTPLEAVGRATPLDGWSDHTEGLDACYWALAQGIKVLEVHICLPGRGRNTAWDKTPDDLRRLRRFADSLSTIRTGVSQTFRERWSASR